MKTNEKNFKILCIIPARGGSKGVERKNIRSLNGKPLIAWTIEAAKKSIYLDKVVVSTEDAEIAEISKAFGADIIERPEHLAQDSSPTMDSIFYTVNVLKNMGYDPDYVMLLQCTSPLRTVKHIDEAIENLLGKAMEADSLLSVTKEEHPPWWLMKVNEGGLLEDFMQYDKVMLTRRQDFPDVYRQNGAIYMSKTEKFYEYQGFEGDRILPYIMDAGSSIDIDTEKDFKIAELFMKE